MPSITLDPKTKKPKKTEQTRDPHAEGGNVRPVEDKGGQA